jgi:hypothetical protein
MSQQAASKFAHENGMHGNWKTQTRTGRGKQQQRITATGNANHSCEKVTSRRDKTAEGNKETIESHPPFLRGRASACPKPSRGAPLAADARPIRDDLQNNRMAQSGTSVIEADHSSEAQLERTDNERNQGGPPAPAADVIGCELRAHSVREESSATTEAANDAGAARATDGKGTHLGEARPMSLLEPEVCSAAGRPVYQVQQNNLSSREQQQVHQ